MKSLLKISLGLVVSMGALSSCDDNVNPYQDFTPAPPLGECEGPAAKNDTVFSDTMNTKRKIVLEEYTGVKCQNCPDAAVIAKNIASSNPEDVILVAVHASSFAKPNSEYPDDFRTEAGNELYKAFTPVGLPAAMFNRKEINGSVTNIASLSWESTVNTLKSAPDYQPYLKVKVRNIYNPEVKKLRSSIYAKVLRAPGDDVFVTAYILEDNVTAPQLHGSNRIANYKHKHMLRMAFPKSNGNGAPIFMNPSVNDAVTWDENGGELCTLIDTEKWKTENLEVVYLFFLQGSKEIIHAEKVHLTTR